MIETDLAAFYETCYDESTRLIRSIKGQLEAARVRETLCGLLPEPPARVADIGGGTGTHAAWLQARGYRVDLVDPIRRHVDAAKRAGIHARVVRPCGTVVVVAFNRHANLLGATLDNQLLQRREVVEDIETNGCSDRHDRISASAYYHTPGRSAPRRAWYAEIPQRFRCRCT